MKMGEVIKRLRKQIGYTQAELAEKIGRTPQVISNWERSYTKKIDQFDLDNIAEAFQMDTAQFTSYFADHCAEELTGKFGIIDETPCISITGRELELIHLFRKLDASGKEEIEHMTVFKISRMGGGGNKTGDIIFNAKINE